MERSKIELKLIPLKIRFDINFLITFRRDGSSSLRLNVRRGLSVRRMYSERNSNMDHSYLGQESRHLE